MEKIRFAPLIRVSTEKQEKKGESLETQTKQIKKFVELRKGVIPVHCWKYKGQEHATPNQERLILEQLLEDSSKNIFDAVIVTEASRWSRDNRRSKEGLDVLRANGIRFFVGAMEFDLNNPHHEFMLGISAEINEMFAKTQAQNSIINRIERARAGRPSAGKLPFGRTWNEKDGWNIDDEKKLIIETAAKRYLSGEPIPKIAKSYGMNAWNLWKILTKRSGPSWSQHFKYKDIDETVIINIPPLLDQKSVDAIKEKIRINTTYTRGNRKHYYLLSGFIYCKRCGYMMRSFANHNGKLYYVHSRNNKDCNFHNHVPALELENSVLLQLIKTFGDPELVEKAIQEATPDKEKREKLEKEQKMLADDKRKLTTKKENLIKAVEDNSLDAKDILPRKNKLNTSIDEIIIRLNTIENELAHIPDPKEIKKVGKWAAGSVLLNATRNSPKLIFERPYEWRRNLVERAFSGIDFKGSRLGVYVDTTETKGVFKFEISGSFFNTVNTFPLSDDQIMDTFHFDPEYQTEEEIEEELKLIKLNLLGKCHAYKRICFYQ